MKNNMRKIQYLTKIFRKEKSLIVKYLMLKSLATAIQIYIPVIMAKFIDVLSRESVEAIIPIIARFAIVTAILLLINYAQNINYTQLILIGEMAMKYNIMSNMVSSLDVNQYTSQDHSYLASRIDGDIKFVCTHIWATRVNLFFQIISTIGVVIILFGVDKIITLGVVVLLVMNSFIFIPFKNKLYLSSLKAREATNDFFGEFSEYIFGIKSIKLNWWIDIFNEKLSHKYNEYQTNVISNTKVQLIYGTTNDVIQNVLNLIIMLFCGSQILKGELLLSSFFLFTNYLPRLLQIQSSIMGYLKANQSYVVCWKRLEVFIHNDQLVKAKLDRVMDISCTNISKSYLSSMLFENVSFRLSANGLYTISGPNGKGKSTLLDIILGIQKADSGEIKINDISINNIDMDHFRSEHVCVMEQKPRINNYNEIKVALFSQNSVKKNLAESMLNGFNINLDPDEFTIGENRNLSGGELRKLNIIRMLLSDKDFLVFDEPTNDLDNNSITFFLNQLNEYSKIKKILIVTHSKDILDVSQENFEFS